MGKSRRRNDYSDSEKKVDSYKQRREKRRNKYKNSYFEDDDE